MQGTARPIKGCSLEYLEVDGENIEVDTFCYVGDAICAGVDVKLAPRYEQDAPGESSGIKFPKFRRKKGHPYRQAIQFAHDPPGHTCGLPCCSDGIDMDWAMPPARTGCMSVPLEKLQDNFTFRRQNIKLLQNRPTFNSVNLSLPNMSRKPTHRGNAQRLFLEEGDVLPRHVPGPRSWYKESWTRTETEYTIDGVPNSVNTYSPQRTVGRNTKVQKNQESPLAISANEMSRNNEYLENGVKLNYYSTNQEQDSCLHDATAEKYDDEDVYDVVGTDLPPPPLEFLSYSNNENHQPTTWQPDEQIYEDCHYDILPVDLKDSNVHKISRPFPNGLASYTNDFQRSPVIPAKPPRNGKRMPKPPPPPPPRYTRTVEMSTISEMVEYDHPYDLRSSYDETLITGNESKLRDNRKIWKPTPFKTMSLDRDNTFTRNQRARQGIRGHTGVVSHTRNQDDKHGRQDSRNQDEKHGRQDSLKDSPITMIL